MTTNSFQLTNSDRIILGSALPTDGKYETLICIKDIRKKIEVSQKEVVDWELKTLPNNQVSWKPLEKKYKIEFTELEQAIIKTTLKKLDEKEVLNENQMPLYKMFCL